MTSEETLKDVLRNTLDEHLEAQADLRSSTPSMALIYPLSQHYQKSGLIGQKWMLKLCCMAPGEEHILQGGDDAKEDETDPALGWYRLDDLGELLAPIVKWLKKHESAIKAVSPRLASLLEWFHKDAVTSYLSSQAEQAAKFTIPIGMLPQGGSRYLPISSEWTTLAGLDDTDYRVLEGQGLIFLQQIFQKNQPCGNLHLFVKEGRKLWLCREHCDKMKAEREAISKNAITAGLVSACQRITQASKSIALDRPVAVARPIFQSQLEAFIGTRIRYCFVIGPSGVGKSTALAFEADRLQQQGLTLLLLPGKDFSLETTAFQLSQQSPTLSSRLNWHQIVQLLTEKNANGEGKFILMIDAADVAETNIIARELESLHRSIVTAPLENLKVIVTCRDVAWDEFKVRALPECIEDAAERKRESANSYTTLTLDDFSSDELDVALEKLGASELIALRPQGEWIDWHVASLRALLIHPQNFGYYAELRSSGSSTVEAAEWTWSDLIHRHLEKALLQVERRTHHTPGELLQMLRKIAAAGWRQRSRDLSSMIESLKAEAPELFLPANSRSPFDELVRNGILIKAGETVAFRFTDTGGWLLSLELQARFEGCPIAERDDLLNQWLSEINHYHPMFDATIAWIDRLSVRPDDPQVLDLLQRIITSGREKNILRLLRPSIIRSLFTLLIRDGEEKQYFYSSAGNACRPSPEALKEIRWYLCDPEARARRLAAQLAGTHCDEQAIPDLIGLLIDEDFSTQHAAYQAIENIGKPALSPLLSRIKDDAQTNETRAACLHALRNIGQLNDDVSDAISQALTSEDDEILRAAVLAATLCRDDKQRQVIIPLLRRGNCQLVQAAAKYFSEVPTPEVFVHLEQVARKHFDAGEENAESRSAFRQLIAALVKTDREAVSLLVLKFAHEGLAGNKALPVHLIIEWVEKFHVPELLRPVFSELVKRLVPINDTERDFDNVRRLVELWHPDHLDALMEAAKELGGIGVDLSRLLVDEVAQHITEHDEFPMSKRLNRVKDLQLLAKCQASNLIPAICELLPSTSDLSTCELCEWLWVVADPRAEKPLLTKLFDSSDDQHWHSTYALIRALGTCGGETAKNEILLYLRRGEDIALNFHREVLHPLLRRQELLPAELSALTLDSQVPIHARIYSLLALAEWDAPAHRELIRQTANNSDNEELQAQAVRLLYFTKDASIVSSLRRTLRDRNCHLSVKEQAAIVLGWFGEPETLAEIERAFCDTPASGFIHALTRFKSESSLSVILARMKEQRREMWSEYIEALGAFAHLAQGRAAIQEQCEEWASGKEDFPNTQSRLIAGLALHHPHYLLQTIIAPYDKKHLHTRGRKALAKEIRSLIVGQSVEWAALLPVMTRLISDEDLEVREIALQGLIFAPPDFCCSLFEETWSTPNADEWKRAAAVVALGFTQGDERQLEYFRHDADLLVRQAADIALRGKARHSALSKHVGRFQSTSGVERLSAWLCLTQKGDWATSKLCLDACSRDTIRYAFQEELIRKITDNDQRSMEKRKRDQQSSLNSRGAIAYD